MLNFLLLYRLIILNLIGFVGVAFAFQRGWAQFVLGNDSTGIVYAMIVLFIVGLVSLFVRANKVTRLLNDIKAGIQVEVNGPKFLEKNAHLDDFPTWIATVGLVGNVLGILIAFGAIDAGDLGNADATQRSLATLMDGMHVAFSATVVGGILSIWADVNRRILKTASVLMIEDAQDASWHRIRGELANTEIEEDEVVVA